MRALGWTCRALHVLVVLALAFSPAPTESVFGGMSKKKSFEKMRRQVQQHTDQRDRDVAALEASSNGVFYTVDADPLGKAAEHVPQLRVEPAGIARTAVVSLPDGIGAGQWVDAVWVKDQDGNVLHLKRFENDPGQPHPGMCVPSCTATRPLVHRNAVFALAIGSLIAVLSPIHIFMDARCNRAASLLFTRLLQALRPTHTPRLASGRVVRRN